MLCFGASQLTVWLAEPLRDTQKHVNELGRGPYVESQCVGEATGGGGGDDSISNPHLATKCVG